MTISGYEWMMTVAALWISASIVGAGLGALLVEALTGPRVARVIRLRPVARAAMPAMPARAVAAARAA